MDDDFVLNLAVEDQAGPSKAGQGKKGGRWTERVKAKRVAKRKTRNEEPYVDQQYDSVAGQRPSKKPRKETSDAAPVQRTVGKPNTGARPPTQIISSLFSYNPKVERPINENTPKSNTLPSNAPLADSSTFSGLGLDPLIVAHLSTKMDISKPTSIQRAALPILLSPPSTETSARDVFIQSQTGSGKTLSFLLPIIQDLLPLSSNSYIDRSIGTLAIIIAPTRELAKQISDVLEALLKLRLRAQDESAEDAFEGAPRLTRWLVSGLLTGGATRTHEKARLRKGVPILVSTPGRLLDHLQKTASFNVGKCRWLVLDEADRLMELGFEETIQGILKGLDGRRKLAMQAVEEGKSMEVGGWDWSRSRRTILCSATIRDDVQKLAGTMLHNPIVIKATENDLPGANNGDAAPDGAGNILGENNQKFTPPSQLSQKYVVVPLKLRLVTLIALLRTLLAQSQNRRGTKIIVFLSCTDSVDFHWKLIGGTSMDGEQSGNTDDSDDDDDDNADPDAKPESEEEKAPKPEKVQVQSSLLPDTSIFRLHGSLPLQTRLASLRGFSAAPNDKSSTTSSILLCTSVASRGLDLPLVRAVVQYDLPTEGGVTEYVHRVGRTARVGKGGEAWSFVGPSEVEWVKWIEERMQGDGGTKEQKPNDGLKAIKGAKIEGVASETVLRKGFGGKGSEYEERATEVQLAFERWVLKDKQNLEAARKAFLSHIRAYATHPSNEKHIFHIRFLHLGHLAKAFALREAPTAVTGAGKSKSKAPARGPAKDATKAKPHRASQADTRKRGPKGKDLDDDYDVADAERRMEQVVRAQGRLTKKGGKMVSTGTSEFQIADGYSLERLVNATGT